MTSEGENESEKRVRVSASQIQGFESCQIKWAIRYILGIEEPSSPAQEYGTRAHARVERYLAHGEHPGDDEIGITIQAAMRPGLLPPPIVGVRVEHEFSLPLGGGHEFIGFIDAVREPVDARALVLDHKFVRSLRWAKSESELRTDPQSVAYARAALDLFPGVREVDARWIYYQKGTRIVERRSVVRTLDEIGRAWTPLEAKARDLVRLRQAKVEPQSLQGNEEACDSYGGCPHQRSCAFYQRRARGKFGRATTGDQEMTTSLLEKLKAMKAAEAAPAQAAPPPPAEAAPAQAAAPTPPAAAAPAPAMSALAKLQALKGAKGANPPAKQEPAPAASPALKPHEQAALDKIRATKAAQSAEAVVADISDQAVAALSSVVGALAKAEEKTAAPAEKPKRAARATASQPASAKASTLSILFGCAVVKQPGDSAMPVQLVELLGPIMREVADSAAKAHWALIPYAEGKALLAHAFDAWLTESGWKGTIYVDERSAESQAVREVLLAHADVVLRGVA